MKAFLYIVGGAVASAIASVIAFSVLTMISPLLGAAFIGFLVYKIIAY